MSGYKGTFMCNYQCSGFPKVTWQSPTRIHELGRWNSSVGNASDLVTHRWAAHHCVGGSNPNACERSLASHAVYMLIQCTPLLVEKAGVAPVVTFRITARKQERVQARYPLWIWNPWGRTHEVQNRSNQWLHKMDLGPKKKLKKKKNTWVKSKQICEVLDNQELVYH